MKKSLKIKLLVGATFLVVSGLMARGLTSGNVAQTQENHPDPALRTRRFETSTQEMTRVIQKLVPTLHTYGRAWKVTSSSTRNGVTTIACEVPVLFFTDDLIITIRGEKEFSRIDVRSASRVGKNDLGENRRHVLQPLRQLNKVMPVSAK